MKPTTILVNTARGSLIDEAALVEALKNGAIAGAGLDVFESEQMPHTHPLLSAPNTVLTPHIAGSTKGR
jgi:D-3-phosphoglycerate dehydrogenase